MTIEELILCHEAVYQVAWKHPDPDVGRKAKELEDVSWEVCRVVHSESLGEVVDRFELSFMSGAVDIRIILKSGEDTTVYVNDDSIFAHKSTASGSEYLRTPAHEDDAELRKSHMKRLARFILNLD